MTMIDRRHWWEADETRGGCVVTMMCSACRARMATTMDADGRRVVARLMRHGPEKCPGPGAPWWERPAAGMLDKEPAAPWE